MSRSSLPRRAIDRRAMLKGLLGGTLVGVGLPMLEAMLDSNGTAFADGDALPTRFGLWFFGNGVRLDSWTPTSTGANWQRTVRSRHSYRTRST